MNSNTNSLKRTNIIFYILTIIWFLFFGLNNLHFIDLIFVFNMILILTIELILTDGELGKKVNVFNIFSCVIYLIIRIFIF